MAIIGKMDPEQLKKMLAKKQADRERAAKRREAREDRESERNILRQNSGLGPLATSIRGSENLNRVATQLRKEREEATQQALYRRNRGKWISRDAQRRAAQHADRLAALGY